MDLSNFYNLLFEPNEAGCFGGFYNTKVEPISQAATEFYCVNPLDASKDHDASVSSTYALDKPRRANLNVTAYRNFVFEMDKVSLEDQITIIEACEIPFTAIVYSGNKSYHCVLSLKTPLEVPMHHSLGVSLYKKDWKRLAAKLEATAEQLFPGKYDKIVDTSTQNPSRLTRCPFFVRQDTGKEQTLVKSGKRIAEMDYFALLKTCPVIEDSSEIVKNPFIDFEIKSVGDFWYYCPTGLKNKIRYSERWVKDTGMYPEMFRITTWAIDHTGINKELFLKILELTVFKSFDKIGYPEFKYKLGVNSGYKYKQQRS